ncbi:MAG TPA: ABC transporter ATP-binding protein [Clostridiales bacterium]|jgi:putative ABC transport system ATP-binding protein|nr:ABC transporter ATP-binding protein [Clostridiales bacterium]
MLSINNISKTFNIGTINEKQALDGVNLFVNEGDFITVIGGNGAGKSTLLNIIAGVYMADDGELILDGDNITKKPEYKRAQYFGRVFQDPLMGTAASMEIQENLALAYRRGQFRGLNWAITPKEKQLYEEQLKRLGLGLESRMTTKVGLLSGGQRQALALLMAILKKPKMLLLDEHTAALDPNTAQIVQHLTLELTQESKITTLMITHNMKDAIKYGNRLIMMHEGKIIYEAEGAEKQSLKVEDLLKKFEQSAGGYFATDRMLLA